MDGSARGRALDEARARGIAAARAFDTRLRLEEAEDRQELLLRGQRPAGDIDRAELEGLRAQVSEFRSFYFAVIHSRGWKLMQALRRTFGRAW